MLRRQKTSSGYGDGRSEDGSEPEIRSKRIVKNKIIWNLIWMKKRGFFWMGCGAE